MDFMYGENVITCDPTDVDAVAKQVDLDWKIVQQPALYRHPITNELITTRDCYTLRVKGREVTKLSVTGKDHVPIEPKVLLRIIARIAERMSLRIEAAGHTREGKYIYALCSMGDYSKINKMEFNQYLLISTSNEGNQKTRLTPLCINNDLKVQLPVLLSQKPTESSVTISHHYSLDADEVVMELMEKLKATRVDYEASLNSLVGHKVTYEQVSQFHHVIYRRFKVGSSVKKEYDSAMTELMDCYKSVNSTLDNSIRDSFLAVWIAFNHYFDNIKSRRGGLAGKIHSINFGADEKTKREAFSDILELYSKVTS